MQNANLSALVILALKSFVQNRYGVTAEQAARILQDACEEQLNKFAQLAVGLADDKALELVECANPAPAKKKSDKAPKAAEAAPAPKERKSRGMASRLEELIGGKELTFTQIRNLVKKDEVLDGAIAKFVADGKAPTYDEALKGLIARKKGIKVKETSRKKTA